MFYILTVGKVRSPTLEVLAAAVTLGCRGPAARTNFDAVYLTRFDGIPWYSGGPTEAGKFDVPPDYECGADCSVHERSSHRVVRCTQ